MITMSPLARGTTGGQRPIRSTSTDPSLTKEGKKLTGRHTAPPLLPKHAGLDQTTTAVAQDLLFPVLGHQQPARVVL